MVFCSLLRQVQADKHPDISSLDHNMEQLVKEIVKSCQRVFANAGSGLGQTVSVYGRCSAPSSKGKEREMETLCMRERTMVEVSPRLSSVTCA